MPDVSTEVANATTTLGSAASTITFNSISSAYTDLRLVIVAITSSAADFYLRFNADSATNYSFTRLAGAGSTADSGRGINGSLIYVDYNGTSSTIPQFYALDIFSYAGSTFKTLLLSSNEDNNGSGGVARLVGLWRSTSAINQITLTGAGANFAAGTTATLYGIL